MTSYDFISYIWNLSQYKSKFLIVYKNFIAIYIQYIYIYIYINKMKLTVQLIERINATRKLTMSME